MVNYKNWYQGTTQEAFDKVNSAIGELIDTCLYEILKSFTTLLGWVKKLLSKIIKICKRNRSK
jgi:hypothetical protein